MTHFFFAYAVPIFELNRRKSGCGCRDTLRVGTNSTKNMYDFNLFSPWKKSFKPKFLFCFHVLWLFNFFSSKILYNCFFRNSRKWLHWILKILKNIIQKCLCWFLRKYSSKPEFWCMSWSLKKCFSKTEFLISLFVLESYY